MLAKSALGEQSGDLRDQLNGEGSARQRNDLNDLTAPIRIAARQSDAAGPSRSVGSEKKHFRICLVESSILIREHPVP
jgi:hypothetical protein